jgi:hypothetical protein
MWSAGVLMYLMMYLKYPYDGNNIMELSIAIDKGIKTEPSSYLKNKYSSELENIVSSLLSPV